MCKRTYARGCRFAKWRSVIKIGENLPSDVAIDAVAVGLAKYALICQQNGLVPIVEPEVLIDGTHTIEQCMSVTQKVLGVVFTELHNHGVSFEGMLLKPNMVLKGKQNAGPASFKQNAEFTIHALRRTVVAAVPGIFVLLIALFLIP